MKGAEVHRDPWGERQTKNDDNDYDNDVDDSGNDDVNHDNDDDNVYSGSSGTQRSVRRAEKSKIFWKKILGSLRLMSWWSMII